MSSSGLTVIILCIRAIQLRSFIYGRIRPLLYSWFNQPLVHVPLIKPCPVFHSTSFILSVFPDSVRHLWCSKPNPQHYSPVTVCLFLWTTTVRNLSHNNSLLYHFTVGTVGPEGDQFYKTETDSTPGICRVIEIPVNPFPRWLISLTDPSDRILLLKRTLRIPTGLSHLRFHSNSNNNNYFPLLNHLLTGKVKVYPPPFNDL